MSEPGKPLPPIVQFHQQKREEKREPSDLR